MKKNSKLILIIALAAVIALMTACPADDSGDDDPTSATYTSYDTAGNSYTLEISKNPNRAAYSPQAGDSYVLTIKNPAGEVIGTSTGTVTAISDSTFTLESGGVEFFVTISGSAIIGITAADGIPVDGGDPIQAPSSYNTKFEGTWVHGNPDSGPAQFTFTGNAFIYTGEGGPKNGTFTFDDANITFTDSNGGTWNTTYTLTATSISFTQGTGNSNWGGTWYGTFNKTTTGEENKSIKIENITGFPTTQAGVFVFAELPNGNNYPVNTAIQYGEISNGVLSVDLVVPTNNTWNGTNGQANAKWKGEGDFYVALVKVENQTFSGFWVFTNGEDSPVKVSFTDTEALTTLDFDKFKDFS